jgi:hypothetical protein
MAVNAKADAKVATMNFDKRYLSKKLIRQAPIALLLTDRPQASS